MAEDNTGLIFTYGEDGLGKGVEKGSGHTNLLKMVEKGSDHTNLLKIIRLLQILGLILVLDAFFAPKNRI